MGEGHKERVKEFEVREGVHEVLKVLKITHCSACIGRGILKAPRMGRSKVHQTPSGPVTLPFDGLLTLTCGACLGKGSMPSVESQYIVE